MATPTADSYSAASGVTIYAGLWRSLDAVVAGDSLTSLAYSSGGYRWGLPPAKAPLRVVYNAGVPNNTLDDLWARWGTDVLARTPPGGWVLLRIGTNSLGDADAVFKTSYRRFIDSAAANNLNMVLHAIPPKQGVSGSGLTTLNAWIAAQAALTPSILKYTNDSLALGDASYTYNPADYIDGIHMNGSGMYKQGVAMATDFVNWFPPSDPRITDGTDTYAQNPATSKQWVVNPLGAGTGGDLYQCSGAVPLNWGASNSSLSNVIVMSAVAADAGDANQTPWVRGSINSVALAGHTFSVIPNLQHPAVTADLTIKRLDVVIETRLNALNGSVIDNIELSCPLISWPLRLYMPPLAVTKTMTLRTSLPRDQAGQTPAAHAANTITCGVTISFAATSSAFCGSIDFRCASVRAQAD